MTPGMGALRAASLDLDRAVDADERWLADVSARVADQRRALEPVSLAPVFTDFSRVSSRPATDVPPAGCSDAVGRRFSWDRA